MIYNATSPTSNGEEPVFLLFAGWYLFCFPARAYTVQRGDTLSTILQSLDQKPIYGPQGSLSRLLKMNPQIQDPNFIYPDQNINLGGDVRAAVKGGDLIIADQQGRGRTGERKNAQRIVSSLNGQEEDEKSLMNENQNLTKATSKFAPVSELGIMLGEQYLRLNAIDKSTKDSSSLLSDAGTSIDLFWKLYWNSDWSSIISMGMTSQKILKDSNRPQIKILNTSQNLKTLSIALQKKWSNSFDTLFRIGIREKLFSYSPLFTEVSVDSAAISYVDIKNQFTLYQLQGIFLKAGFSFGYLSSGKSTAYKILSGYHYEADASLSHEFYGKSIFGRVYFGQDQQNTSLIKQKETDLGIFLGFSWSFIK